MAHFGTHRVRCPPPLLYQLLALPSPLKSRVAHELVPISLYAPYLVGMSDKELKQEAQYLIFSSSQNAFSRGGQTLFLDFNLHTGIPSYLADVPAIGPGGKYTGKTYKDYLNPNSLQVKTGYIEPSVKNAVPLQKFQFERLGYYNVDYDSKPEHLVFNCIVPLKDGWIKEKEK